MWTTLEPEDRNQIHASAQRQPTASITDVIIVVIVITTIILLLTRLMGGSWALPLGAALQAAQAVMTFRPVSVGHPGPITQPLSLNHKHLLHSHKCLALSLWGQFSAPRACSGNKNLKNICKLSKLILLEHSDPPQENRAGQKADPGEQEWGAGWWRAALHSWKAGGVLELEEVQRSNDKM